MASGPPPNPPPHGQNPRPPGASGKYEDLPAGNYDIFIIPPHSAGAGFLYLPSLAVQRNSFLAGVACTLLAVGLYTVVVPALRDFLSSIMAGGGLGVLILIVGVGVGAWAFGKTQAENTGGPRWGGGSASGANQQSSGPAGAGAGPRPQANGHAPPPHSDSKPSASSGWEKAKEETRKREEARKREEEAKKKREEAQKAKEEAERASKAKQEKDKWEQARAREKEQREREARERIAREREAREKERANTSAPRSSPHKSYEKPTARSYAGTEDEYSYRPYDSPRKPGHKSAGSSVSGGSEGSYAASQTTARTTPPPSQRGPYTTKDPDKIQIKAVYLFSDTFPLKPLASLISNQGSVTDGLVLHIATEGLFIDDDIRGVPQREWDVKAWTLKLVEDGMTKNKKGEGLHVLRVTARDADNKKYTFVLDESEAWKVAVGLARLRKGSQVRALGMNGMKEAEVSGLLGSLGWL
ncbi:hypothetical protein BDY17DRAFT_309526 [Neohortaea acidophila]|uniref:Uncharacterized protein n=1 Tax=Neohortaea acidophila TaxID=245834 RepID=A0A6A6PW28_9PEZI|nr:uncharacterized protein BDY17DRAFT_309526 [Neohortaea acidophila]KAF2484242.1 hypothetical protein BDY17DRAFT_309526 [Neohortaea acidophila]